MRTSPLRAVLFVPAVLAALIATGCSSDEVSVPEAAAGDVTALSSEEGLSIMGEAGILVIDVRPVGEYRSGHLVGAQSIDASDDDDWTFRTDVLDHDRPTVVYCSDADCSAQAAQRLVDAGFTQVYDLGGIEDWDPEFLAVEEPSDSRPLQSPHDDGN